MKNLENTENSLKKKPHSWFCHSDTVSIKKPFYAHPSRSLFLKIALPWSSLVAQMVKCLQWGRPGFNPRIGKIPWRRKWQPTPVLLPEKFHGRRSLVGYSPWGHKESDTTEWLHFHVSLSWIGEGNGNPLQCSCLENPRDGGAWWAAVYGVPQSRTRLTRLSSSSSSSSVHKAEIIGSGIVCLESWISWGVIDNHR